MIIMVVLLTAILIVLSILVAGLLRSYATVLKRLHQLDGGEMSAPPPFRTVDGVIPPSVAGPDGVSRSGRASSSDRQESGRSNNISGVGLRGEVISVLTAGTEFDTFLIFLSSGCSGCAGFWQDLAQQRERTLVRHGRVLVVTKGPESESIALLAELCPAGVDLVMSNQAWSDYGVPGSPYVVVIDGPTGQVKGEGSGTSLTQVSGLVYQSVHDSEQSAGPPAKPRRDAEREVDVDRVLLAAGISPGDPSLYPSVEMHRSAPDAGLIGWPGIRSRGSR